MDSTSQSLIDEIKKRVQDRILERTNADLLIKLITNADSLDEAINIAALGTTYKRTGLHFDKRLEKMGNAIRYFKKNEKLSFRTDETKPVNKLIIGDNYQALQNLLIQYRDKIDVIYIDPPYGKDSMGEFAKTNYNNAITRDNLLSMLYPRLVLARHLLSDEGVIFCSIDDKNQAYVKCLFDEIFGEENFITCFTRKTKSSTGDDGNGTNIQHDYLLVYGKYKNNVFLLGDEKSFENYKNPDNDPNGEWCSGDPSAKSGGDSTYFPIKNPYTQKVDYPPEGRFWAFSKNTMNEYIKEGRITFKKEYSENQRGFVFKRYKNKMESIHSSVDSLFAINNIYMNQSATNEMSLIFNDRVFDYPKPMCFVKKLIQFSTKKDSSVLDFFAGSGTTGHAVLDLNKSDGGNRTFILCQLNEKTDANPDGIAYDVTSKRLKRIMTGECYDGSKNFPWLQDNEPYGGNLDVYEIEEIFNSESTKGKTPFDVIDETLYGKEKFQTVKEKIEWVCQNFDKTQTKL